MRLMPHRVANADSVELGVPQLWVGGQAYSPKQPVSSWDYLSESVLLGSMSIARSSFLASTGLPDTDCLAAVMQVDCPVTGFRAMDRTAVDDPNEINFQLNLPAERLASRIDVTYGVLLDSAEDAPRSDRVAHRRGSRLYPNRDKWSFILEGDGSGFPVEAFDFAGAGFPRGAAWKLQMQFDSLDEQFLATIRLQVNTSHPRASELLTGQAGTLQSVLMHDVVQQMLLHVADSDQDSITDEFDDDSVAGVLNGITHTYLGQSLAESIRYVRNDRSAFLTKLQEATGFLGVVD